MTKSWIQVNGKLIPKDEYHGNNSRADVPNIMPDIEPFKSPITGELIRGRGHLRRHMKEHGVTNSADYSPQWYERKAKERQQKLAGQDSESRAHRIELIKHALER